MAHYINLLDEIREEQRVLRTNQDHLFGCLQSIERNQALMISRLNSQETESPLQENIRPPSNNVSALEVRSPVPLSRSSDSSASPISVSPSLPIRSTPQSNPSPRPVTPLTAIVNSAPLLPHGMTIHDVQAYQRFYHKIYSSEPRRKLGNKLIRAFFPPCDLSHRNFKGNVKAQIGVLDQRKTEFLRSVVFRKYPAVDENEEELIWEGLTKKWDEFIRGLRFDLKPKTNTDPNQK